MRLDAACYGTALRSGFFQSCICVRAGRFTSDISLQCRSVDCDRYGYAYTCCSADCCACDYGSCVCLEFSVHKNICFCTVYYDFRSDGCLEITAVDCHCNRTRNSCDSCACNCTADGGGIGDAACIDMDMTGYVVDLCAVADGSVGIRFRIGYCDRYRYACCSGDCCRDGCCKDCAVFGTSCHIHIGCAVDDAGHTSLRSVQQIQGSCCHGHACRSAAGRCNTDQEDRGLAALCCGIAGILLLQLIFCISC